jgi:anionic cell wall polymer biosynthesis LytR-Cps2A-Psr (LCP) family protein
MTGLRVTGTVTVSLGAVRQVTDALGGVSVCLPEPVHSIHTGQTYPMGCHALDGTSAADLVRQRGLPTGGYGRDRDGRLVLTALAAKASSLNLFADAGRIAALARTRGVTVSATAPDLAQLAWQLRDIDVADVVGVGQPRFNTVLADGIAYEQWDPAVAPVLFAALRNDTMDRFVAAYPAWVLG